MARYAADMLDEIDELMIRLGMRFASGDPAVVFHPFDPGWCPDVALQDFNDKACVFTGGKPTLQGPFANPEVYRFPEPVGEVLICSHSHDESYTLPFYVGKGLQGVRLQVRHGRTSRHAGRDGLRRPPESHRAA